MTACELIAKLSTLPPNTLIGAFNRDAQMDTDVIDLVFTPGEGSEDYSIPPSAILKTASDV